MELILRQHLGAILSWAAGAEGKEELVGVDHFALAPAVATRVGIPVGPTIVTRALPVGATVGAASIVLISAKVLSDARTKTGVIEALTGVINSLDEVLKRSREVFDCGACVAKKLLQQETPRKTVTLISGGKISRRMPGGAFP